MRILLDANLSYRILKRIKLLYPDAAHVSRIALPHPSDDPTIWSWARDNDFVIIVSNDSDFKDLVQQHGPPPKVIYLRFGNVGNDAIVRLLTEKHETIRAFLNDPDTDLMEIFELT